MSFSTSIELKELIYNLLMEQYIRTMNLFTYTNIHNSRSKLPTIIRQMEIGIRHPMAKDLSKWDSKLQKYISSLFTVSRESVFELYLMDGSKDGWVLYIEHNPVTILQDDIKMMKLTHSPHSSPMFETEEFTQTRERVASFESRTEIIPIKRGSNTVNIYKFNKDSFTTFYGIHKSMEFRMQYMYLTSEWELFKYFPMSDERFIDNSILQDDNEKRAFKKIAKSKYYSPLEEYTLNRLHEMYLDGLLAAHKKRMTALDEYNNRYIAIIDPKGETTHVIKSGDDEMKLYDEPDNVKTNGVKEIIFKEGTSTQTQIYVLTQNHIDFYISTKDIPPNDPKLKPDYTICRLSLDRLDKNYKFIPQDKRNDETYFIFAPEWNLKAISNNRQLLINWAVLSYKKHSGEPKVDLGLKSSDEKKKISTILYIYPDVTEEEIQSISMPMPKYEKVIVGDDMNDKDFIKCNLCFILQKSVTARVEIDNEILEKCLHASG